jgi:hypothetical protein
MTKVPMTKVRRCAGSRTRRLGGQVDGVGRDAGTATAELAVVLPILAAAALLGVWAVLAGAAHLRCVDAAGEGARALARGEAPAEVERMVREVAPPGATVDVTRDGDLVVVSVDVRVSWPGPWQGDGPAVQVGDRAVALAQDEDTTVVPAGRAP